MEEKNNSVKQLVTTGINRTTLSKRWLPDAGQWKLGGGGGGGGVVECFRGGGGG